MNLIKTYSMLTKPGIIIGNLITTAAGFCLASKGALDVSLFLSALVGLGSIIASACVFNNYIDRFADEKMDRTKHRPLVQKTISTRNALLFALLLVLFGSALLYFTTNLVTLAVALAGFFIYVLIYSFVKYHSSLGTLIGAIAGATPPLVGYCAITGTLDLGGILLFLILLFWQMPHFNAIAIYRLREYAAAGIPVLPLIKGIPTTKLHSLLYLIAFNLATPLLFVFHYTGYIYLITSLVLGIVWLLLGIQGFRTTDDKQWAKRMFRFSLIVIMALSFAIAFDTH